MKWDLQNLFVKHAREIDRFLRRRGHTVESAADLTQDAFVKILMSGGGQKIENPRAYLHQIARNLSVDAERRERRLPRAEIPEYEMAAIADTSPLPDTIVSDRQLLMIAEEFLARLPERTRYAFEAHRMGEKTISEIAAELDLSTTRTWTLIRNSYDQLRAHIQASEE